ncbi:MAG: hypothetical protein DWB93_04475 [Candidatus Poseidoniales archaeon]|nr:MAG: hypothetical protein DWB93_04475 [Candidatus Poseidoniales archaeon]
MGKRKCAAVNCNALEFRSVGYCNRHKNFYPPLEVIITKKSSIIHSNDSDIRYDIDGNKNRINSKRIDKLLLLLKSAKRYWVVDLGKDEDEFVQYAVIKGELEHWDDSKKIESKKMKMEEAFEILESKLLGNFTESTKWWDDEEDLEKKGGISQSLGIISLVIFVVLVLLVGNDDSFLWFLGKLGGDAICGLIILGGGALTSLNRSSSGKFKK